MNVGGTRSVLICRSNPPLIRSGVITPALLPGWTWCSGQDASSRGRDSSRHCHWHSLKTIQMSLNPRPRCQWVRDKIQLLGQLEVPVRALVRINKPLVLQAVFCFVLFFPFFCFVLFFLLPPPPPPFSCVCVCVLLFLIHHNVAV